MKISIGILAGWALTVTMVFAQGDGAPFDLGEMNHHLCLEPITGCEAHHGIEFDGTSYWITGTLNSSEARLYEMAPDGTVVNQYGYSITPGADGWLDLACDGPFLYTGSDCDHPGYITQIDPATGSPTGTYYGPYPAVPCRALAYDPATDSFWTANGVSDLYQCFRNGSFVQHTNPSLEIHGAAMETRDPLNPMLWWWCHDGSESWAMEFDPSTATFTGKSFQVCHEGGSIVGGACCRLTVEGHWELVGLFEVGLPYLAGFDLGQSEIPLQVDKHIVFMDLAGPHETVNFFLDAGTDHAHRMYGIFGTASGTTPGTVLPGGLATLPINWDVYTDILFQLTLLHHPWVPFLGSLDAKGQAEASLTIPLHVTLPDHLPTHYAFCLNNPFDFASNAEGVLLYEGSGSTFVYDDGSSENALGWSAGGHVVWAHAMDAGPGEYIFSVATAFGQNGLTSGPPNGTPCTVYCWEDPNDDGNPFDGVLVASGCGVVKNTNTNLFNTYFFDEPAMVRGTFFYGCHIWQGAGVYAAPMDQSTPYGGEAWFMGGAVFDPADLSTTAIYEMGSIGFPAHWLLRANVYW